MIFLCFLIAEMFSLKPEGSIEKTQKKHSYELSLIA